MYGINNIGKSTHCKRLCRTLEEKGYKTKYIKYPVYEISPTGSFLYQTLRTEGPQKISEDELQMWFILNRYQYQNELKKLLEDGYVVVAEDYSGTGIAWGTAKGLDQHWLIEMNKFLLKEDLAIMLDGRRNFFAKEKVHVHEQNDALVDKCREVHKDLAKKFNWKIVNIQPKIKDTAEMIFNIVDEFLR